MPRNVHVIFKPHWSRLAVFVAVVLVVLFSVSSSVLSAASLPTFLDGFTQRLTPEENQWLKQHPVIRIAGPRAFPPFHFYDESGNLKGMASEYMRLIAGALGFTIEIQGNLPWPEVLERAKSKWIDVIACSAKNEERSRFLLFSKPYMSFPMVIVTRKDSPFVGGLEDLNGKRVAVLPGVVTQDWLKRDRIAIIPHIASTPLGALEAVATGLADAHIENLAAASYLIQQKGLSNLKIASPTAYEDYKLYIAVRDDWPELVPLINKVLDAIPPETHSEIRNRWLTVRYEHGINAKTVGLWGLALVGVFLVGFLAFYVWNRNLKKQIIERQIAEKRLAEQESTLRSIFRAAPTGIGMTVDRVITRANDKLLEMTGYDRDELVGHNARMLYASDEEYEFVGTEKYGQILKAGTGTVETQWIHKDGTLMDIILSSTPIDPDDWGLGVTFTALDITDRKQLEERLRQSSKMEAVGTLSGGIAHDFNNILAIILGNTELAMVNVPDDSKAGRYLDEILTASFRARDLVGQLLTFSRKSETRQRPIDISPIVKESMKMLRATIEAGIEFSVSVASPLPTIMADPTQIHQIMINLCTNAADAMGHDQGHLSVDLKAVSIGCNDAELYPDLGSGEFIKLVVRDTGKGIRPEIMERVFDPYFTTKEIGKGTGLGLAVTHGIVKSHNGSIWISSSQSNGTVVEIFFPVVAVEAEEPLDRSKGLIPTGTGNILFVDDEKAMVSLFRQRLGRLGYHVTGTTDPERALAFFKTSPDETDILITDMTMPKMSGVALIKEILAIRPDMPTILCTGYSETLNEASALASGASRYLEKPIEIDVLAQTVADLMKKS